MLHDGSSMSVSQLVHQQKIPLHISKYIAIYINKIIVNFKIQAAKYLQIQVTSKMQSTTRNVYFTIPITVCKGCMGHQDYKNMYLSARTADCVILRLLVIECREYMVICSSAKSAYHTKSWGYVIEQIENSVSNKRTIHSVAVPIEQIENYIMSI